jgi:hypothetical protein
MAALGAMWAVDMCCNDLMAINDLLAISDHWLSAG